VERFRPGLPAGDLRCHIGVSAEAGFLLSVGRLQRRKGFDAVIRSVARLKARGIDVHYALIGIGEQMQELKALDKVAYVRFASVYRHFRDIGEFMTELKDLLGAKE
jgi:phosphatidylinositol alpha-1,6-mannosyltransferase